MIGPSFWQSGILPKRNQKVRRRQQAVRVNRLYLEMVNPNYREAYGVGSAKTQFYQPYILYPSSTQGDLRGELEAFKTTTQNRLNRLEAGSSAGPGQFPRNPEDLIFLYKRNCLFTIVWLFTVSKK